MSRLHTSIVTALALLVGAPVAAATFDDPTWPCVQRKVENLSAGLMWPQPIPDGNLPDAIRTPAIQLAETMALRRVPLEDVETAVAAFVADNAGVTDADLGHIFQAAFDRLNQSRSKLINGISRYSLTQIDLAARIESARIEMDQIMAQEDPDFDRVDALEEQLDWDQRIYRDRAQSLTYVCETPVLLEKRAYAVAQVLSQHLSD
ncbi:hypothetical protein [Yoonia sediminilitoris]|uniref:Uncharacterized protein n=1 Tax=Yoonia sediminilitoris TaxID=1286148 RepID=A0A2T6KSA3_9RHOB|nr:hypothetical protein [Yoonia sediminilitoris]PUB19440.1 hypothetical protein C8N45_1011038 [Yoonia sediminilitoris]RCW99608.1 hypothetical protein DFP92_1011038 [Yoonia sediminilitoris]